MRNHDEKAQDMARSVLPSSARRMARMRKQASAQRARAADAARLHRLLRTADHPDDFDEPLTHHAADLDDRSLVPVRRSFDKVAPLLRWATATVDADPALRDGTSSARTSHFARLLGHGLPGRHALAHLEADVLGHPNPFDGWEVFVARMQAPRPPDDRAERLATALHGVIAIGAVGDLNRAIKHDARDVHVDCDTCRSRPPIHPFPYTGDPQAFLTGRRRAITCACSAPLADPGPRRAHSLLLRFARRR